MLRIGNKCFMNIQEAVAWLLKNNWLPFQANVNFVANTDINLSDIIGTAPVDLKVGSLVLFKDLKVGTVTQVDVTTFQVASEYTDFANAINGIADMYIDGDGVLYVEYADGSIDNVGSVRFPPALEDIEDMNGHKRFIEGNINVTEQVGLIIDYAKWSLSGTHLQIVIAGSSGVNANVTLYNNVSFAGLPSWVLDKIYPLGSGDNVIYNNIYIYNNGDSTLTTQNAILIKNANVLDIYHLNPISLPANSSSWRLQFDLLIDSD